MGFEKQAEPMVQRDPHDHYLGMLNATALALSTKLAAFVTNPCQREPLSRTLVGQSSVAFSSKRCVADGNMPRLTFQWPEPFRDKLHWPPPGPRTSSANSKSFPTMDSANEDCCAI